MKKAHKKMVGFCGIVYLIMLQLMVGVMAANELIIGSDPELDQRSFEYDWINDNLPEADLDNLDDLDAVYDGLCEHWDDPDAAQQVSSSKYDFADITQIKVENLDEENATYIVSVKGDAESTDYIWFLYIWTDCGNNDDDAYYLIGLYYADTGLGGGDVNIYVGTAGNENVSGEMDFNNAGHDIEMTFPSDWWDNAQECQVRAMIITTAEKNPDSLEDIEFVIDIYPCSEFDLWALLFWLLLILLLIAIALLIWYLLKRRNRNRANRAKNSKRIVK